MAVTEATGKIAFLPVNVSSGTTELVAGVSGSKIRVLGYVLSATGALAVTFKSAVTALTGAMPAAANGVIPGSYSPVGHFETADGEALNLTTTGDVDGHLVYQLVKGDPA